MDSFLNFSESCIFIWYSVKQCRNMKKKNAAQHHLEVERELESIKYMASFIWLCLFSLSSKLLC